MPLWFIKYSKKRAWNKTWTHHPPGYCLCIVAMPPFERCCIHSICICIGIRRRLHVDYVIPDLSQRTSWCAAEIAVAVHIIISISLRPFAIAIELWLLLSTWQLTWLVTQSWPRHLVWQAKVPSLSDDIDLSPNQSHSFLFLDVVLTIRSCFGFWCLF